MSKISIPIELPAISKHFSASYSKVRKPTGVEYMLLSIIGTVSMEHDTWGEVMDSLKIQKKVFDMVFKPALEQMASSDANAEDGMIYFEDTPTFESFIGEITFTKSGKQAFESGVIAEKIESFNRDAYFTPASASNCYVPRFSAVYSDRFDETRFSDIQPDDQMIENMIKVSKKAYGVPDDADIFDIVIEKQKEIECYRNDVILELDQNTGTFSISAKDLEENFLKNRYDSNDLISSIPDNVFKSKNKDIVFKSFRDTVPNWERYTTFLPFDINIKDSKLILLGSDLVNSDRYAHSVELGCDILSIESSVLGYEYCLVRLPASIDGFPGTTLCNLVIRRTINDDAIREILVSIARKKDITSINGLKEAIATLSISNDDNLILEFVEECLSKSKNIRSDIETLQNFRKEKWYKNLPEIIEKTLSESTMIKDPQNAVRILTETNTQIDGKLLANRFKREDIISNMDLSDKLLPLVRNKNKLISTLGIEDGLVNCILDNSCADYVQPPMSTASNMSKNLKRIKSGLGIVSPSEYNLDLDGLSKEKRKELSGLTSTFRKDFAALKEFVRSASRFSELAFYDTALGSISPSLTDLENLQPSEKQDDRLFGITLGVMLEHNLREIVTGSTLENMLIQAHEEGFITDGDYKVLDDFRNFRNSCAHDIDVPPLDKNKKRRLISLVKSIRPEPLEEKQ